MSLLELDLIKFSSKSSSTLFSPTRYCTSSARARLNSAQLGSFTGLPPSSLTFVIGTHCALYRNVVDLLIHFITTKLLALKKYININITQDFLILKEMHIWAFWFKLNKVVYSLIYLWLMSIRHITYLLVNGPYIVLNMEEYEYAFRFRWQMSVGFHTDKPHSATGTSLYI